MSSILGEEAVLRKQVSQPSRQPESAPSSTHSPLHRVTSFGSLFIKFLLLANFKIQSILFFVLNNSRSHSGNIP
jgi:hypothetical protein